jgi:hypothetical protein
VVDAPPEIARLALAWEAADSLVREEEKQGRGAAWDAALYARGWAWIRLEDAILKDPQRWYTVGDWQWTCRKRSACGLELVKRPSNLQQTKGTRT